VIAALVAALTLNQPAPHVGDAVTFTAIYGQDAARQARQPQYPNQPTVQVNCDGYQDNEKIADRSRIKGGWQGITYPFMLPVAGQCAAALYYFDVDNQLHVIANAVFEVAP